MPDIIQLLPDAIANQIAAGEVVQRPASVIKELMENAVDAGAKQVQVIIKEAGKSLIQVIDDGKGMSETDARMSFERHATSKIRSADDLFAIRTFGFRGGSTSFYSGGRSSRDEDSSGKCRTRPSTRHRGIWKSKSKNLYGAAMALLSLLKIFSTMCQLDAISQI